jgi:hypothetical protein
MNRNKFHEANAIYCSIEKDKEAIQKLWKMKEDVKEMQNVYCREITREELWDFNKKIDHLVSRIEESIEKHYKNIEAL